MRILLVEDEEPKLKHIVDYLRKQVPDLQLSTSRSVHGALMLLDQAQYDLVVLDMSLPTFDVGGGEGGGRPQGFGGRELIRNMELEGVTTPVIVLTGYDAFNKAGGQIGIDTLNSELRTDHPDIFLGLLHFSSAFGDWQSQLTALLDGLEASLK